MEVKFMSIRKKAREEIIDKILTEIWEDPSQFSVSEIAKKENLTEQSIYRYLNDLEAQGVIKKSKKGRKNTYSFIGKTTARTYKLNGLSEDSVWRTFAAPFFSDLPSVPLKNLNYAFTEILNNAIDHSDGEEVAIFLMKNGFIAQAFISDDGVGIFTKISTAMNLEEKNFAILELAKGKFTTEPRSHTGEGIFFSSKVVDRFAIFSENLVFLGSTPTHESLIDNIEPTTSNARGTVVYMEIKYSHTETSKDVFDKFTQAPEDYGFSKTIVPVRLLEYGDPTPLVISRSQAKRLMMRFERFQNIVLDFSGIEEIGQGFADELFRVFPSQHPGTLLTPINCNDSVAKMISRVRVE